jgi:hypothetical protein
MATEPIPRKTEPRVVDPRVETLASLRSIDATLKAILLVLSEQRGAAPGQMAPTVNLDGPHGDPVVKAKDPRDWAGDSQQGRKFSECPAEYLDLVADRLDYFAEREEDAKKAGYNRLDAARARGWAARKRAGWTPPVTPGRVDENAGEPRW